MAKSRPSAGNSLAEKFPDIAKSWDTTKNGCLTPYDVSCGSHIEASWLCENCGASYTVAVYSRVRGKKYCNDCAYRQGAKKRNAIRKPQTLFELFPDVALEWDYENNDDTPKDVAAFSHEIRFWICSHCGKRWSAPISSRSKHGKYCRECSMELGLAKRDKPNPGESLADLFPEIAKDWDYAMNPDKPSDIKPQSHKTRFWRCHTCGHSWQAMVGSRTSKGETGCPKCSAREAALKWAQPEEGKSLADMFPSIAEEWDYEKNSPVCPEDVKPGSNTKRWWLCRNCGHSYEMTPTERTARGRGCAKCRTKGTSFPEQAILWYIRRDYDSQAKSRAKIKVGLDMELEIDIYIEDERIAIEHDGLFWHRNRTDKDELKSNLLAQNNIRLIRIAEGASNDLSDSLIVYDASRRVVENLGWAIERLEELLGVEAVHDIDPRKHRFAILGQYKTQLEQNSLAMLYEDVAAEWNYEKNFPLTPFMFTPGSGVSVWWRCKVCEYEWQAVIGSRTRLGAGCPDCANRRISVSRSTPKPGMSLADKYPEIAALWDYESNLPITPQDVMPNSTICEFSWIGKCNHRWKDYPASMVRNEGRCPYCERSGIGKRFPC